MGGTASNSTQGCLFSLFFSSNRVFPPAFAPPPKVDSALIRLVPKANQPPKQQLQAMEKLTAAAFGQRRKMLRGALKGLGGNQLLEAADIDPARRAETLTVQEFEQLMLMLLSK